MMPLMLDTGATQVAYHEPETRAFRHLMSCADEDRQRPWQAVFAKFILLAETDDDWDGAGADAPVPEVIAQALQIARRLYNLDCPAPNVVRATPDGCVSLEWHDGNHVREIEVSEGANVAVIEYELGGDASYSNTNLAHY